MLASTKTKEAKEQEDFLQKVNENWQEVLNHGMFLNFMIMDPGDGRVILSTTARDQGKYMDHQSFFQNGKKATFAAEIYYDLSLERPVLMIGSPIKDLNGNLMAVLAGQINLSRLSQLMEMRNPLSHTEDSYLVNTFNFFITEPRFGKGSALKKTVYSKGVETAINHGKGVDFYNDYRGIPVIGAYTWLETWRLCLITEIDQSEAYAPIYELKNTIAIMGAFATAIAGLLGWLMTGTITGPVARLVMATRELSQGNLDVSIETTGNDEIAGLANSFSQMAVRLKTTLVSRDELSREIIQREKIEKNLQKALKEVKRSNEDLNQFAYVASHDLQEPLRMVSSYTQLLEKRYNDLLDEKGKKFIFYAVDGANRMQLLIQDLLAFSRVKTQAAEFEAVDTNKIVMETLANLTTAIEESQADITLDTLPVVISDKTQLTQVFQNLIGNAIKFKVDLPPQIHISAIPRETEWLFSVQDNGIGIAPEYKDKIFVIFQRLHTRREYPGTGIGLALCKRIINRHGGKIWFESSLVLEPHFSLPCPSIP